MQKQDKTRKITNLNFESKREEIGSKNLEM